MFWARIIHLEMFWARIIPLEMFWARIIHLEMFWARIIHLEMFWARIIHLHAHCEELIMQSFIRIGVCVKEDLHLQELWMEGWMYQHCIL